MCMLRRWLRIGWVVLLALALPLQGLAAAARLHCASALPAPAVSTLHAGHEHHAAHAHDHTTLPDASVDAGAHAGAKCSACAACCAAAALPAVWPALPVLTPPSTLIAFQAQAWSAPVPGGPERPPRTHLA